ncbi:MAG: hypothetical protein ISQ20_01910 [Alphaproteobacteria bacterium]|nr:hypothetical protein [Alphaproteobacteria bacterium]
MSLSDVSLSDVSLSGKIIVSSIPITVSVNAPASCLSASFITLRSSRFCAKCEGSAMCSSPICKGLTCDDCGAIPACICSDG